MAHRNYEWTLSRAFNWNFVQNRCSRSGYTPKYFAVTKYERIIYGLNACSVYSSFSYSRDLPHAFRPALTSSFIAAVKYKQTIYITWTQPRYGSLKFYSGDKLWTMNRLHAWAWSVRYSSMVRWYLCEPAFFWAWLLVDREHNTICCYVDTFLRYLSVNVFKWKRQLLVKIE